MTRRHLCTHARKTGARRKVYSFLCCHHQPFFLCHYSTYLWAYFGLTGSMLVPCWQFVPACRIRASRLFPIHARKSGARREASFYCPPASTLFTSSRRRLRWNARRTMTRRPLCTHARKTGARRKVYSFYLAGYALICCLPLFYSRFDCFHTGSMLEVCTKTLCV